MSSIADPQVTTTGATPAGSPKAPLDDLMLAMDVVDTLRHNQDLVVRELDSDAREKALIEKLRDIYKSQGIEVPDAVLKEGVAALGESRFAYTPPKPGLGVSLAKFYVNRKKWGPAALAIGLMMLIGLGGYFLAYRPFVMGQQEAARIELAEKLPAEMDALYQTIFTETKVQRAVVEADELRLRGKSAAAEGDRTRAADAIAGLTTLRDKLRQEYSLRVVSRPNTDTGFWRTPDRNTDATNYYIVVEALAPEGGALSVPILNEETGQTDVVALWGVRVPETVYDSVRADQEDDGIIQRNTVGIKQFGFLDVDYTVPVLGGAVTKW